MAMADFPIEGLPPSTLTNRSSKSVNIFAVHRALGGMMLGFMTQANRMLECLYQYNVLDLHGPPHANSKDCFHFAWAQTKNWPSFILKSDPNKPSLDYRTDGLWGDSEEVVQKMEDACRRSMDTDLNDKYPHFYDEDLNRAITKTNTAKAPNTEWLSHAVEIALLLNYRATAECLLRKYLSVFADRARKPNPWHARGNRYKVARVWSVWPVLNTGFFAQGLSIEEEEAAEYVDGVLAVLKQRLENGPMRPFKDRTMKGLVTLLDKTCAKTRLPQRRQL